LRQDSTAQKGLNLKLCEKYICESALSVSGARVYFVCLRFVCVVVYVCGCAWVCVCSHPKQQEREKNHKEALKKEGSVYKNGSSNAEDAYKSLWSDAPPLHPPGARRRRAFSPELPCATRSRLNQGEMSFFTFFRLAAAACRPKRHLRRCFRNVFAGGDNVRPAAAVDL